MPVAPFFMDLTTSLTPLFRFFYRFRGLVNLTILFRKISPANGVDMGLI